MRIRDTRNGKEYFDSDYLKIVNENNGYNIYAVWDDHEDQREFIPKEHAEVIPDLTRKEGMKNAMDVVNRTTKPQPTGEALERARGMYREMILGAEKIASGGDDVHLDFDAMVGEYETAVTELTKERNEILGGLYMSRKEVADITKERDEARKDYSQLVDDRDKWMKEAHDLRQGIAGVVERLEQGIKGKLGFMNRMRGIVRSEADVALDDGWIAGLERGRDLLTELNKLGGGTKG